jgi:hypothetical protein
MSDYFVLPLTLLGIAAVLFACNHLFERFFGRRRHQCSFCGAHHSKVAKLIEGVDGYICNNCVKVCSEVLIKECAEYRESFRGAGAPKVGPPSPAGDSAAQKEPPPATSPQ